MSGCLNLFGREVRVLDWRFVFSVPSAYPRIDVHNIDFSLVLADVGIAMEKGSQSAPPKCTSKSSQTL